MEIIEHLVMDNQVVVGDELHVAEHFFVSNEIAGVGSFGCVGDGFHIFVGVDFFLDLPIVSIDVDFDVLIRE